MIGKIIHRRFYDWLASRSGIGICIGGMFLTVIAALMYGEMAAEMSKAGIEYALQTSKYADNLGGKSYEARMCQDLPIDVVYTWVNGSDPQLLADLAAVKLMMELEQNRTLDANRTAAALAALQAQASSEQPDLTATTAVVTTEVPLADRWLAFAASLDNSTNSSDWNGTAADADVVTVAPLSWDFKFTDRLSLAVSGLQHLDALVESKKLALEEELSKLCGAIQDVTVDDRGVAAIVVFESKSSVEGCIDGTVEIHGQNVSLGPVHYIGNQTLNGLVPIEDAALVAAVDDAPIGFAAHPDLFMMVAGVPDTMPDATLVQLVSAFGNATLVHRYQETGLAVIEYQVRMAVINALDKGSCGVNDISNDRWEFEPHVSTLLERVGGGGDDGGAGDSAAAAATGGDFGDFDSYAYRHGDDMWQGDDALYGGGGGEGYRGRHLLAALGDTTKHSRTKRPHRAGPRRTTLSTASVASTSGSASDLPRPPTHGRTKPEATPSHHRAAGLHSTKRATESGSHRRRHRHARPSTTVTDEATAAVTSSAVSSTADAAMAEGVEIEVQEAATMHNAATGVAAAIAAEDYATEEGASDLAKVNTTEAASVEANVTANVTTALETPKVASNYRPYWNYTIFFLPVVRVGAVSNLTSDLVEQVEKESKAGTSGDGTAAAEDDVDEADEISSSRFQDNSELQYSLRSIEKFAPWVRHIYIVTNGQIPGWLDLNHPRISIVEHKDIFRNQSHLPVFSSPAIEAHLHQIPGLSKKFVYLNDDVMFGTEVWPDDFYTHSKGQKIYEAWPVPNCVDACPSNWINDKYCDQACNNAECEWDGGDCTEKNKAAGSDASNANWGSSSHSGAETCKLGCSDAWLGDKFCDNACSSIECGMDGGDCGIDQVVHSLQGYTLEGNETDVWHVAGNGTTPVFWASPQALYVNLSNVFDRVDSGFHDSPDALNGAVLSQEHQTLVVVIRPLLNYTIVNFTLEGCQYIWEEAPTADPSITSTPTTTDFPDNDDPDRTTQPPSNDTNASSVGEGPAAPLGFNRTTGTDNPGGPGGPGYNVSAWNATEPNETKLVRRESYVWITFSLHVMTVLPDEIEVVLNETAASSTTNETVAITILSANDTTINYWDIPTNASNTTNATDAAAMDPQSDWLVPPNISVDLLPNNTQHALRVLEQEFEDGELTAKGLAKYKHALLAPFAEVSSTLQFRAGRGHTRRMKSTTPTPVHRGRKLQQLTLVEDDEDGEPVVVSEMRSYYVTRAGMQVPRQDAERADAIADRKRKEFSFGADMALSIRAWEQHTGRAWTNSSHIPLKERTPFPWERQGIFDELLAADPTALEGVDASELSDFKFDAERWRSRLPKDTFGDSLKKVNRLYNKVFGYSARKVIAHMPHFIDRTIMENLTKMFPEEWKATSSHRLRSGADMQYAFAYFRYVMELEKNFSVSEAFGLLDLDNSGLLSVHELRTLITRLYDLPTSPENWRKFEDMLLNCSAGQEPMDSLGVGIGPESSEVWVTLALVQNCTLLTDELKRATGKQHVYRHELESDEHDITFEMIRDNVTDVLSQLDAVRKQPKKFVCLNDNIDHRKKTAVDVVDALHNFYQSFFPVRSQFELPIGLRNRFLHMQELRHWQDRQRQVIGGSKVALVAVTLVLMAFLYSGSLRRMRRSWLLSRRHRRVTSTRHSLGRSSSSGTGPAYSDKRV